MVLKASKDRANGISQQVLSVTVSDRGAPEAKEERGEGPEGTGHTDRWGEEEGTPAVSRHQPALPTAEDCSATREGQRKRSTDRLCSFTWVDSFKREQKVKAR